MRDQLFQQECIPHCIYSGHYDLIESHLLKNINHNSIQQIIPLNILVNGERSSRKEDDFNLCPKIAEIFDMDGAKQ